MAFGDKWPNTVHYNVYTVERSIVPLATKWVEMAEGPMQPSLAIVQ